MKTKQRLRPLALVFYSLVMAALACNRGGGTQVSPATAAQQTVEAVLTASAAAPVPASATATLTPEPATAVAGGPSETPSEEATVAQAKPSDTQAPTNTPGAQGCVDASQYVADVTVPDDTVFAPGTAFTKTWRLRNNGTCSWVSSYALAFVGGEAMGGPPSVPITGNVAPGSLYEVSVNLVAPATAGTYKGTWQMRNGGGALFGTKPFVQIIVATSPTATATLQASNTPTATTGAAAWNGQWDTDCGLGFCGQMSLTQTGNSVTGTYGGGGIINGTVDGSHLSGTWSRSGDSGSIDFWMGGGGQRWRGNWNNVNGWCGERSGLSEPSPCGVGTWYGTWTTQCSTFGCDVMNLTQNGANVTGTYGGGGTVTGTVDGAELTGTWTRAGSGSFHFYLISDGKQFQGNWNSTEEWCGYRSGSSLPSPCLKN